MRRRGFSLWILLIWRILVASGQFSSTERRQSLFPPVLRVKSREGYLFENADTGTTVRVLPDLRSDALQILVEDGDLKPGMPPAIYQYVLHGYGAEKFAVDQRGYLYLNAPSLDADKNSSTIQLHVQAREVDTEPPLVSEPISLTIHILDINDNSPTFEQNVYVANVSASGEERFVARVRATDPDTGKFGRLQYRIADVSNGAAENFYFDESSETLIARGNLIPDQRYQITIEAIDGGGLIGRTFVFVTALNSLARSPPVSSSSSSSVSNQVQTIVTELSEATPTNSIVAVLGDQTTKGKVYFTIVDGNDKNRFAIEPSSGVVSTSAPFDREDVDLYTLQIEARSIVPDQSLYWTLLQIAITDVNDNSPEFEGPQPIRLHLNIEDVAALKPNMRIGTVKAKDRDAAENGRISYRFRTANPLFHIDSLSGLITTKGDFVAEHFGEHSLIVVASDNGTPSRENSAKVFIRIDGAFLSTTPADYYEPEEAEENSVAPLLFSRATLPPQFSQTSAPSTFSSHIEQTTKETSSEGMETEIPTAPIRITPTKLPSRLAPIFKNPSLSVMVEENDGDLELTTLEAEYPDGAPGPITFVMRSGDSDLFSISSYTGKLILLKPLDAENNRDYTLVIGTMEATKMATDPMLPHTATITIKVIDVNDWIPNFETNNYDFSINDRTEPGTIIGQVSAFDQDRDPPNNRIHYRIANTDGIEKLFVVNSESGLITLIKSVNDFGGKTLALRLEAQDEGDPPQSTQTLVTVAVEPSKTAIIPINEPVLGPKPGALQFAQRNYTASLLENVRAPYLVQTLTVLNKPMDPRFVLCAIVSGNYRQTFSVSTTPDGNCELRTQSTLDRETIERYLLNVTVTSGPEADFTLISVTILDVNDSPPKFIFPKGASAYFAGISSEAVAFSRVLTVKASDDDLGNSALIRFELDPTSTDAQFFTIDPQSGELSIKQTMTSLTQNNMKRSFELKVVACDSPSTGTRLCTKADVYVNAVSDEHRFMLTVKGAQPQQIRAHKEDLQRALGQFTGLCSTLVMEEIRPKPSLQPDADRTQEVLWFAQNPQTHRICRTQEYGKLFEKESVQLLAGKLKPWFTLASIDHNFHTSRFIVPNMVPAIFLNMGLSTGSLIGVIVAISVAVLSLLVTCIFCICWRRKKHHRPNLHTYPNIYPLPKYSSALYVPGGGTLERDKIYETQMLELPMSDEEFATLKQSSIRSTPRFGAYNFLQPPYRQIPNRPTGFAPYTQRSTTGTHHDDGDFSVDESMYATNTAGRFDPVTKRIHPFHIPTPDYPSFTNQKKSLL